MAKVAILAILKAKTGKENDVAAMLQSALPLAEAETQTISWYAIQIDGSTFGIFDTFEDDTGRQAHLDGPIAAALAQHAEELLADPPKIELVTILAAKS